MKNIKYFVLFFFVIVSISLFHSVFALSGTISVNPKNVGVGEPFTITISGSNPEGVVGLYIYRNYNRNSNDIISQFVRIGSPSQISREVIHSEGDEGIYKYCGYIEGTSNYRVIGVEASPSCIDVAVGPVSLEETEATSSDLCICDCNKLPVSITLFARKKGEEEWKRELSVKTGDNIEFLSVIQKKTEDFVEKGSFIILPEKNINFTDYAQSTGIKDLNNLEKEEINFSGEIIEGENRLFEVKTIIKNIDFESSSWVRFIKEDFVPKEGAAEDSENLSDERDFCICDCAKLPISVSLFARKKGEEEWKRELTVKEEENIEFLAIIRKKTEDFFEKVNFTILPDNNVNFLDYSKASGVKDMDELEREDINFSAIVVPGEDGEFKIKVIVKTDDFENTSWVTFLRDISGKEEEKEESVSSGSIFTKWWLWLSIMIVLIFFLVVYFYFSKKDREETI